ncbi:LPS-assembly protein LptD [Sphingomonas sp. GCM10030256]|uniref:LPS-assembly protein LptD n=1 Tax=Sphingomonas sp. GCM10030256 TaxID=3273427 RepID=UPI003613B470
MRGHLICWTALPLTLAFACPAVAQTGEAPVAVPVTAITPETSLQEGESVSFSADSVAYDSEAELVTASGQVRLSRDGNYVAADQVTWNRDTGQVVATGNVVVVNPEGDKLVGDRVVLTDSLRDGTIDNLLVVMESGGRLAAQRGTRRENGVTTLENAVYSPCPVTGEDGCARPSPKWKITAARVIYNPARDRVRFVRGRLDILGISLPLLPIFSVGTGGGDEGVSGLLLPEIKVSRRNGFELAVPYHLSMAPNRDLTLTPHVYTGALPSLEARYRHLDKLGAFQLGGFVTYGDTDGFTDDVDNGIRAFVEGYGKAQFNPLWSLSTQVRAATDKTVARRYDITRDDKLRSFVDLERIDLDSYIGISGWAFQGLRESDRQAAIPIALPAVDARWRVVPPALGGQLELQANSLAILRRDGQDTQRAFGSARWDSRRLTPWGQELLLTAYGRGDVYHTDEVEETSQLIYRGEEGWHFRGITAAAGEARWPLIGPLFGGVQRLTPRAQVVLTPPVANLRIPNEDARAVDLEDSNLFALNRFPGYDRWEDGSRITYGADWSYDRPNLAITSTVGQSFRLTKNAAIFPDGTGLTGRWSDIVGRTRVQFGRFLDLTHRFRLDKDDFGVRRNEVDLTVGTDETYARIGYLRLNRNIDQAVEDLRDNEELRVAARWKFLRHWSVFGATVLDLTDREEDPLSIADGFEPVRHRASIDYEDECLEIGLSWRRDYERLGEGREGDTFQFRIALKGLGR